MRVYLWGALLAAAVAIAQADPAPAVYSTDTTHLWNRLYRDMAVRTLAGVQYGVDIAEPYVYKFDDRGRLIATLDEFLAEHGERSITAATPRALMLNDVWTAFDIAASFTQRDGELESRLARVIDRLRMPAPALAGLVDNYAAAIKAGTFATEFDPQHPEVPFLPPDLFDPSGPWVQIGESGLVAAPAHVRMVSGRSAFLVFIRCPGGRQATLDYLRRLNLYPTPLVPNRNSLETEFSANDEPLRILRLTTLRLDPDTPQFPDGTIVALVRRMMAIDERFEPVLTPVTQKIQLRVYRKLPKHGESPLDFAQSQSVHEVVMRRRELIAGERGGMVPVAPREMEHQELLKQMVEGDAAYFTGPVVLRTCRVCHSGYGIFSVQTYSRMFESRMADAPLSPQLPPAEDPRQQGEATAWWKKRQFDWGLLRGILLNARKPAAGGG